MTFDALALFLSPEASNYFPLTRTAAKFGSMWTRNLCLTFAKICFLNPICDPFLRSITSTAARGRSGSSTRRRHTRHTRHRRAASSQKWRFSRIAAMQGNSFFSSSFWPIREKSRPSIISYPQLGFEPSTLFSAHRSAIHRTACVSIILCFGLE